MCWLSLGWGVLALEAASATPGLTNLSVWVYPGPGGRLLYRRTPVGDRILDFSDLGFRLGTEPLPTVAVRETLSPAPGDDGPAIQAALNRVASLPPDNNGFRGAVLLTAGQFDLTNPLYITNSGVVLRGAGPGLTQLRLTTTNPCELLRIVGSDTWHEIPGASWAVTDKYVPVGARSVHVAHTNGLTVNDRVMVHRPATDQWLRDIGMDSNGWLPGKEDIFYDRRIVRIEGNLVTFDAPLANSLDQRYGGGRLFKYSWPGRIRDIGVMDLEAVSSFDPSVLATNTYALNHGMVYYADMNHPDRFLYVDQAEDVFVCNAVSRHFINGFIQVDKRARAVTVRQCWNVEPVSLLIGARRYSFDTIGQLVLVQDCYDEHGRHPYANRYTSAGPTAFVDCLATNCYTECSPRHRWTTGALYDNVLNFGQDGVHVRNWGSLDGRGYTGANCVVWNCRGAWFVVNNPPTAQNWLVGPQGNVTILPADVGATEPGIYDSLRVRVSPRSLYHAQRQQRLAYSRHELREYPLGDFDLLTADGPADQPPLDEAWRAQVGARFPGLPFAGFDTMGSPQIVAFSFTFALGLGEAVVGGSLDLGLKSAAPAGEDWLLLDDVQQALSWDDLGWLPLTTNEWRGVDLAPYLDRLADGQLHVAIGTRTAVDWAVLNLEIAHRIAPVFAREPEADAWVEDGPAATLNFGAETTLATGWSETRCRHAYLRFDLNGLPSTLTRVRVQLMPLSGSVPMEQSAMLVPEPDWDEHSITWNTQPAVSLHLADWVAVPGQPVQFDVTHAVQEALAGSRKLCLRLGAAHYPSASNVIYGAREAPQAECRPRLVVFSETPVISPLPPLTVPANAMVGPLSLRVEDLETPACNIRLRVWCSDPTWLPPQNIVLGGSGHNRTLTFQPVSSRAGSVTVWMVATDADGAASTNACPITFTTSTNLVLSQFTRLDPLSVGAPALCYLGLTNQADQPALDVVVSNRLSPGISLLSLAPSQGTCTVESNLVRCDLGRLDPGAAASVVFTFAALAPGRVTNEASVHQAAFPFDPAHHFARAVLEVDSDSDADGLPDAYELAHGLDPHAAADAGSDADGDGLSNYHEYQAGTDPRDAASAVKLLAVDRDGDTLQVMFATTPGRLFQLKCNPQFPSDCWEAAGQPVAGTGATGVLCLPIKPSATLVVYRLEVWP